MLKTFAAALAALALVALPLHAQDFNDQYQPFSDDQLDNLLAPVALYPDPLLAQVLVAATFPDQIDDAARFVRADLDPNAIDYQPWDVSVKAVAHYPAVIEMMSDKLDWTVALGQAYVNQSTDVMASVQRLRAEAREAGNLVSTPQMEVVYTDGDIEIWPAQPQYIYVPLYDPAIVYFRRAPLFFGAHFIIGAWLNYDFDWRAHRVYYHGWDDRDDHDHGWIRRSRPFIRRSNIYVNLNFRNVTVNRDVNRRQIDRPQLNRYDDVHRDTRFDKRGTIPPPPPQQPRNNKIIDRNFNTNDPRLNIYRGHANVQPPPPRVPQTPAFTPTQGGFDPRVAAERGRTSRFQPPPQPQIERKPVTIQRSQPKVERKPANNERKPEKVERKRP